MNQEAVRKSYERAPVLPLYGSLRTIVRLVGAQRDVLDVGCASGYLGKLLIPHGHRVYGIDGNEKAVEEARGWYDGVLCADLNKHDLAAPFQGKTFDTIIFADVLEHLLEPEEVLRYFRRLLKTDGKIIVSLPNVALWRVRLNLLLGRFDYADYGVLDRTHLHLYTFASAQRLLEGAGYRVTATHPAMNLFGFGVLTDLFPFLRSLLAIHIILEAVPDHDPAPTAL